MPFSLHLSATTTGAGKQWLSSRVLSQVIRFTIRLLHHGAIMLPLVGCTYCNTLKLANGEIMHVERRQGM